MDACHLEKDPGLHPLIWEFPINRRDEILAYLKVEILAYFKVGPNQPKFAQYPFLSVRINVVGFNLLGLNYIPFDWSILENMMLYIVCHAIFLVNHL